AAAAAAAAGGPGRPGPSAPVTARLWPGGRNGRPARAPVPSPARRPRAPDGRDEPLEPDRAQGLRGGPAGRPVVAHPLVPEVQHAVPVLLDRLPLRRSVDRGRPVAARGVLALGPDAAPEVERPQERPDAAAEPDGLRPAVLPPRRGAERAGQRLQVDPGREDASPERVLEVAPSVQPGDLPRDLVGIERVD